MCMKIILVVSDGNGKNVVFVTDTLHAYSLDEAVQLARDGKFEGVYAVSGKHGAYLRTRPRVSKKEELETLAVSPRQLFMFANDAGSTITNTVLQQHLQLYERTLKKREAQPFVAIGGIERMYKKKERKNLQSHQKIIFDVAEKFKIFFAAVHIRALIDRWKRFADLDDKPEIIATLYSIGRGKSPHGNPKPNKRGLQISGEFYRLAQEWLQ